MEGGGRRGEPPGESNPALSGSLRFEDSGP